MSGQCLPCAVEMKGEVTNSAWFAVVENLLQLKLLRAHPERFLPHTAPFHLFSCASFSQTWGMILAPRLFFDAAGQKANSFKHAQLLVNAIYKELGVTILLASLEESAIEVLHQPN